MVNLKLSAALEDYLETIYVFLRERKFVRVNPSSSCLTSPQ